MAEKKSIIYLFTIEINPYVNKLRVNGKLFFFFDKENKTIEKSGKTNTLDSDNSIVENDKKLNSDIFLMKA